MEFFKIIYCFLYDWQTLAGSLLALCAAWRTIIAIRKQTKADADRHHDAQRRKLMAARARMPDALSELSTYVRGCGECLANRFQPLPEAPISAVTTMKEVIEFIDNSAAERTFELVSLYQVLRSRLEHGVPTQQRKIEFLERAYDVTFLQAYINSLFEYARNEANRVETTKPSPEEMNNALTNAFPLTYWVRHEDLHDKMKETIQHRHGSAPRPGSD